MNKGNQRILNIRTVVLNVPKSHICLLNNWQNIFLRFLLFYACIKNEQIPAFKNNLKSHVDNPEFYNGMFDILASRPAAPICPSSICLKGQFPFCTFHLFTPVIIRWVRLGNSLIAITTSRIFSRG